MSNRVEIRDKFISNLQALGKSEVSRSEIKLLSQKMGIRSAQWFTKDESNRVARGMYRVPSSTIALQAQVIPMIKPVDKSSSKIKQVILLYSFN